MNGNILDYDFERHIGVISAEDGSRYKFTGGEFNSKIGPPRAGMKVDFEAVEGGVAIGVYPQSNSASGPKDKVVAALLAFFLGGLGIHKFYLGKTSAAVIMLLCGTLGWLLILPPFIVAIIAFIEFIIYLTKDEQTFQEEYVHGDKAWF